MAQNVSKTTTDHETIQRWVEERGGWPAEVEATASEGQTGIIRIDFPGHAGEGSLRKIAWDEWFRKFDDSGLAFVYEDTTAAGERSNFNKLVARETAQARAEGRPTPRRTERTSTRSAPRQSTARAASRAKRTGARGAGRATAGARVKRGAAKRTGAKRGGTARKVPRGEAARTASRRGGRTAGAGGAASRRGGTKRGAAGRSRGSRTGR